LRILGWGETDDEGTTANALQTLRVPVCKAPEDDGLLRTKHADLGQGARRGDSGGPLYDNDDMGIPIIRGLISHSIVSRGERSTYFTDVDHYQAWIYEVLASLE
jgi:secreted trypsin-like serine protease